MSDVLSGFASVALIIFTGWMLGRSGILGASGGKVLNQVVFWVAMPCLLISTLADGDSTHILGKPFLVAAASALLTGILYVLLARPLLGQRGPELVSGAMASSYNNVANLGIPIVVAVVGDPTVAVPALLFQIAGYAPLCLSIFDTMTRSAGSHWWTPLKNPMTIAAVIGITLSLLPWNPPHVIMDPIHQIGHAAIPLALIVFGISMYGAPMLRRGISPRRAVALASVLKLVVHPALAFGAAVLLGLENQALLAAVVVAALPTAQNVFIFSSRYARHVGTGLVQARDCALVTSMACVPVILLITLALR